MAVVIDVGCGYILVPWRDSIHGLKDNISSHSMQKKTFSKLKS